MDKAKPTYNNFNNCPMFKIIVAVAEEHDLDFYALYTR